MNTKNKPEDKLYERLCKFKQESNRKTEARKKQREENEINTITSVPKINKDKYYHQQKDSFFTRLEKYRTNSQPRIEKDVNTAVKINVNRVSSAVRVPVNKSSSSCGLNVTLKETKRKNSEGTNKHKALAFRNVSQENDVKKDISNKSIDGLFSTSDHSTNLNRSQCLNEKEAEIFRALFVKKYGKPIN
jgi:hypothetical protein